MAKQKVAGTNGIIKSSVDGVLSVGSVCAHVFIFGMRACVRPCVLGAAKNEVV